MKKFFTAMMVFCIFAAVCGTASADITEANYSRKEQIVRDLKNWALVENYLRSAVIESKRDIANALKIYKLIPADSPIYAIRDSESNLIVPKSDMTALHNMIKTAMEDIEAAFPVYLTGQGVTAE